MFPFAMQAKLAEAWFDAAAAGFALAGSMGVAAARSLDPWLPGARPSYAFSLWTPVLNSASAWPWCWFAGFHGPPATNWWQAPLSFYGNWMHAFSYGASPNGWLTSPQAWMMAYPLAQSTSAFLIPFGSVGLSHFPTAAETAMRVVASYRTPSGHATAAIFDALTPRPIGWGDAMWKMTPMSIFAL